MSTFDISMINRILAKEPLSASDTLILLYAECGEKSIYIKKKPHVVLEREKRENGEIYILKSPLHLYSPKKPHYCYIMSLLTGYNSSCDRYDSRCD